MTKPAKPQNPSHLFRKPHRKKPEPTSPCPACLAPSPGGGYCSRAHELAHVRLVPRA
jgi:hypothetical protein